MKNILELSLWAGRAQREMRLKKFKLEVTMLQESAAAAKKFSFSKKRAAKGRGFMTQRNHSRGLRT